MRNIFHQIFSVILLFFLPAGLSAQCYELIWSEEFDYTGFPDPAIWSFETGGGGWGNNELQYYKANDADNAWVEDGTLVITAINESYGGRNYTSARILTRNKYSVEYGKIEARIRLPYGQGIWPAFWTMGVNYGEVGWPACGEIDIMEFVGGASRDNQVHGTAHWDHNGSHAQHGGSYRLPNGIFADDFHTFSIQWTPQYIRWYVDGIQYHALDIRGVALSEFRQPAFIILNLAVGGNWPGSPDASTVFPQKYEIDYVRAYKQSADIQDIPIQGDSLVAPMETGMQFSLPDVPGWSYQWSVPDDAIIESGQGSPSVTLTWGCDEGQIHCEVTGECGTYLFSKRIDLQTAIIGPQFIDEFRENVLLHTASMTGTTYEWNLPSGATIVKGEGSDSIYVNWGASFDEVRLVYENACGIFETTYTPVRTGQYAYPDIGAPHPIPGVIEAVDFDYGGPGVAYHDTSAGNQGNGPRQDTDVDTEYNDNGSPNVGWIISGEWLEYTVRVKEDAYYAIDLRMATNNASGGPLSVYFNDEERISGIMIANTGGWSSFITKRLGTVYLTRADTLMRLSFKGGGFNVGKIFFTTASDPTSVGDFQTGISVEVFPVPAVNTCVIQSEETIKRVTVMTMAAHLMDTSPGQRSGMVELDVSHYPKGIYLLRIETESGVVVYRKMMKMNHL